MKDFYNRDLNINEIKHRLALNKKSYILDFYNGMALDTADSAKALGMEESEFVSAVKQYGGDFKKIGAPIFLKSHRITQRYTAHFLHEEQIIGFLEFCNSRVIMNKLAGIEV